ALSSPSVTLSAPIRAEVAMSALRWRGAALGRRQPSLERDEVHPVYHSRYVACAPLLPALLVHDRLEPLVNVREPLATPCEGSELSPVPGGPKHRSHVGAKGQVAPARVIVDFPDSQIHHDMRRETNLAT
ncbi:MAG: hypothetical protein ACRD5L_14680, partial [Bryobacteraceae bacterium]